MYSFSPAPDYSTSHLGFYVYVCLLAIVLWVFLTSAEYARGPKFLWMTVAALTVVGGHYLSFSDAPPVNAKVTGTYKGIVQESWLKQGGTLKMPTTVIAHQLAAQFEVPEGIVVLPVAEGIPIPKYVTLYKN